MYNRVILMGRLTRDPELRTTQSGVNVASFTVAVDRDFGGRDGGERQTDFFDCSAWRQTGEFVSKYFHKGSMIVVSGRMQSRKFQDREGNTRTAWDIQADNVYFGESKRDSDNSYSQNSYGGSFTAPQASVPAPQMASNPYQELEEDDGELPF